MTANKNITIDLCQTFIELTSMGEYNNKPDEPLTMRTVIVRSLISGGQGIKDEEALDMFALALEVRKPDVKTIDLSKVQVKQIKEEASKIWPIGIRAQVVTLLDGGKLNIMEE